MVVSTDNSTKEVLYEKCSRRQKQVNNILNAIGEREDFTCKSLFIYGNTACGKTFVVKNILETLQLAHSYINCIECFTTKLLFENILRSITPSENRKPCSTMMDFIRLIKQSEIIENNNETFYIVLDKADRIRQMDAHLLPAFLRLSELTSLNICVIFITDIIFEKFMTTTGVLNPLKIHFGDYIKDDLQFLMLADTPEEYSRDFYNEYCGIIISVFYMVCRDLNELRHLAIINFSKFVEPIQSGEITTTDMRKLWTKIVPHLKKALQTVYLREVSSEQWEKEEQRSLDADQIKAQVELPYYSKYLLLASYYASYNPATTDRRFFAKKSFGRMSKRMKHSTKSAKDIDKKFLGPKPFTFDRLMAIFYSIVEGGVSSSANILSQLSSLVTLNLLVRMSADDQIDSPKYKCIVPLDIMIAIGNQVDMDVHQYLHDYA